jgi:hypothetical protein
MADNVAITAGSGTNIATDDVSGTHFQRMKLVDGTLDSTTAIASGGGVESAALRVTIASDSTGVVSVDDNGASLTVDGTVTANAGTGFVSVQTEDAASAGGETGTMILGVRNDSATSKTSADGDFSAIATDSAGRVGIADLGGAISVDDNGSSLTVDGTVTANAGTGSFTVAQATAGNLNATVVQSTAASLLATVNNRDGAGNALTSAARGSERALSVQLVDASGNQVTSFGGGTQYTEDGASAGGETGTVFLGVRNDAATSKTSADGDFSAIATDSAGRVGIADLGGSVTVDGFSTVGGAAFVKITDGTNTAVVNAGGGIEITGSTAHDAVDAGNPLKIGAVAEASIVGTANVADGDRTNVYADLDGVMIMKQFCTFGDIIVTRVTDTGGTSTAFSAFGAVASQRNYITTITVYNSSTTNGYLDLRDGTGGTVMYTIPLPALGGATINFPVPFRQTTANTALAYDVSAAISTIYISVVGFKGF